MGPAMGYGLLDRLSNSLQIIRQVARIQTRLDGHHTAADIDSHRGRNDRTLGGNDAPHRGAHTPMRIGHGGDPAEYEGQLGDVEQLFLRPIVQKDAFGPRFNRHAPLGSNYVVSFV